jgi:hypothetical protein
VADLGVIKDAVVEKLIPKIGPCARLQKHIAASHPSVAVAGAASSLLCPSRRQRSRALSVS